MPLTSQKTPKLIGKHGTAQTGRVCFHVNSIDAKLDSRGSDRVEHMARGEGLFGVTDSESGFGIRADGTNKQNDEYGHGGPFFAATDIGDCAIYSITEPRARGKR